MSQSQGEDRVGVETRKLNRSLDPLRRYFSIEMVIVFTTQTVTVGLFLAGLASPLTTAVVVIPLSVAFFVIKRRRELTQESTGRAVALIERLEGLLGQIGRVAVAKGAVDLLDKVQWDENPQSTTRMVALEIATGIKTRQTLLNSWYATLKADVELLKKTAPEQKYYLKYYLSTAVNDLILLYEQYMDTICSPTIRLVNSSRIRNDDLSPTFNLFRQNMWELRGAINSFLVDCQKAQLNPRTLEVKALTVEIEPYKSTNPFEQ